MSIEAISRTDRGEEISPERDGDWTGWVSATDTRNFSIQDPLLDWLELYGKSRGFHRDDELAGYDERTDFIKFLFRKAAEFEAAVVQYLGYSTKVVTISSSPGSARDISLANETFELMNRGESIIYQGVLWNAETRTYGKPDLLIRSDVLAGLFPGSVSNDEAKVSAMDLHKSLWHYRVVDIKFSTLDLLVNGELSNSSSAPAHKAELFIYNAALGRLQGYTPPMSYILGRSWKQTIKGVTQRGGSCMERLAPIPQQSVKKGVALSDSVKQALDWVRRVRKEGSYWNVVPQPSVQELRPNTGNTEDAPWSATKKKIAKEQCELTLLWQVGPDKRNEANSRGIIKWTDPECTATALGVTGPTTGPILQAILSINQSDAGDSVLPSRVTAGENMWRNVPGLEFYVDFETVSDLNDDFSKTPRRGGQPLIFMIGCGHIENGNWKFECFIAESLSEQSEVKIIEQWLSHLESTRHRVSSNQEEVPVFHWSQAELSNLENAYNSARERHSERARSWPSLRWFDLLKEVIKAQPVVIRGSLGFGLKTVAQAMQQLGLIVTRWEEGPTDGLGAMVGAWWCYEEASNKHMPVIDIGLMRDIRKYNEVDCKVMMEILQYLRKNR